MPPRLSAEAFAALVAAAGLPLSADQTSTLHAAWGMVEPMLDRLHAPLPREAEPALIFTPEQG